MRQGSENGFLAPGAWALVSFPLNVCKYLRCLLMTDTGDDNASAERDSTVREAGRPSSRNRFQRPLVQLFLGLTERFTGDPTKVHLPVFVFFFLLLFYPCL